MPTLNVTNRAGEQHQLEAKAGATLMEALRDNDMDIEAICGGCCSCATCHVYIQPEMLVNTGEVSDVESDLLECAYEPDERSRLSCQVVIDSSMDGMVVHIPERQF